MNQNFLLQRDRALKWDSYVRLSDLMADKYRLECCQSFVEIGCWFGVLSWHLRQKIQPTTHLCVDGVPSFLDIAKQTLESYKDIEFDNRLLVPDNTTNSIQSIVTKLSETARWTSLFTKFRDGFDRIETGPNMHFNQFIDKIKDLPGLYLKTDIDGLDCFFIGQLIKAFQPNVLDFEVWPGLMRTEFPKLRENLISNGYQVPELKAKVDTVYLVQCGKNSCGYYEYQTS